MPAHIGATKAKPIPSAPLNPKPWTITRFPKNPLRGRVPLFPLFAFNKGARKGQRVLLGGGGQDYVDPKNAVNL